MTNASASPKLDQTMTLADGRELAYCEWGELIGRPVVLLHGMPDSRLLCPDTVATEEAGVRLITIDRPGYGRSDPRPDRTRLSWVDDFIALLDHLDIAECPVIGWSGGGPYALACAYRLPERVSSLGLAAAQGLAEETPGAIDDFSSEGKANFDLLRRDRAAGIEAVERRRSWFRGDGWRAFFAESWGDADDRLLARPDVLRAMQADLREAARQGPAGYIEDEIAWADPDGFSVSEIQQATHIWIGAEDLVVPRFHADYLVATIPRATLISFPGSGHLFPFDHWAEMLDVLR